MKQIDDVIKVLENDRNCMKCGQHTDDDLTRNRQAINALQSFKQDYVCIERELICNTLNSIAEMYHDCASGGDETGMFYWSSKEKAIRELISDAIKETE